MSSTIHSFRQRSYYLRKRMFCLSTGRWALGTPKSECTLVSTLDWEVNVSWSPLGSGHPQSGEGTPSPRGPRNCTELMEISKLGLKGLWRRWCLFPHILTHCSHSRHLFLPSQLCCPQSSQAARITAAPTPCHGKGSTWWWLRVTTVPGTWPFLASCHSDRSRLAH